MGRWIVCRSIAWIALLLSALSALSTGTFAQGPPHPSFDCRKASTQVEKLICGDPELSVLDRQMAEAFQKILAEAPAERRGHIVDRQLHWLSGRAFGCGLKPEQPAFHLLDAAPPAKCIARMYDRWLRDTANELTALGKWHRPRTAFPFQTDRQPFMPRLLESHDAKLCDDFLKALRQDFLARHLGEGEHVFKRSPMSLGHWVTWRSDYASVGFESNRDPVVDAAELDLDQNGQKQFLLHVARPFNWRGNSYFLLVNSKAATDGSITEIKDFIERPLNSRKTTPLKGVEPYTYAGYIYGYESPVKILAYRGALYLYLAKDVNFYSADGARDGTAVLRRIHADGSTELRCEASVAPKAGTLPYSRAGRMSAPSTAASATSRTISPATSDYLTRPVPGLPT